MSTATNAHTVSAMNIDSRVDAYPWSSVSEHLDAHGWAMVKKLLTTSECEGRRRPLRRRGSRHGSNWRTLIWLSVVN
jgi:hypothetical protein